MLKAICTLVGIMLAVQSLDGAALLVMDQSGRLMGASNVMVDGNAYNVAFVDGLCSTVFGACSSSAFAMPDILALDAANVLLSTVLHNVSPQSINGCSMSDFCDVVTPYDIWRNYTTAKVAYFGSPEWNAQIDNQNFVFDAGLNCTNCDTSSQTREVWAKWSLVGSDQHFLGLVSEPSTLTLCIAGAIVLMIFIRNEKRRNIK